MSDAANPRLTEIWAPYMEWAKSHPRPRFDLCGSNLTPCTIDDLPGAREMLAPNGDNDHGYAPLVEAIASFYGTGSDCVALASGASGANFLVLAALLAPGDEVIIEKPAYDPLLGAARLLGATIKRFERRFDERFRVDADAVAAAITPATRLVVITSPHNPTGAVLDDATLEALGDLGERHGVHVMVDEVYLDTLYRRRAPAATRSPWLISTSSLTKSYGLAGLRAGWVLAAPDVAAAVRRVRGTTEAIGAFPGELLAWVAFQNIDALRARAQDILMTGSTIISDFIAQTRALECVPPAGGTVTFPRLRGHEDAGPFVERLLAEFDTAVVPGRYFESPAHFRIAFAGDRDELAGGLVQISRALEAL